MVETALSPLERHEIDGVLVLTLRRSPINALDTSLCMAIADACTDAATMLERDPTHLRGVVIAGSGPLFSAGVDLAAVISGGPQELDPLLVALDRMFIELLAVPVPVVAAVNGSAIGGGCVLACCADQIVATTEPVRIGLPELRVGVPMPLAALEAVRGRLGTDRAMEVLISGAIGTLDDTPWREVVAARVSPSELITAARSLIDERTRGIEPAALLQTKRQLRRPQLAEIAQHVDHDRTVALAMWRMHLADGTFNRYLEHLSRGSSTQRQVGDT